MASQVGFGGFGPVEMGVILNRIEVLKSGPEKLPCSQRQEPSGRLHHVLPSLRLGSQGYFLTDFDQEGRMSFGKSP